MKNIKKLSINISKIILTIFISFSCLQGGRVSSMTNRKDLNLCNYEDSPKVVIDRYKKSLFALLGTLFMPFALAQNDCSLLSTSMGVVVGPYHSCPTILENDCLKCWGPNDFGQLGYGDTEIRGDGPGEMGNSLPCVDLGSNGTMNYTAIQTATSDGNTCVLLYPNCIKCWGANNLGQLGYGDIEERGDEPSEMGNNLSCIDLGSNNGKNYTATYIIIGNVHTCASSISNCVKCWGGNLYGELGYGDNQTRGNAPGEMGDNLPCVSLGLNNTENIITKIMAGNFHTCIVLNNGRIKCWGGNFYGQLGCGDTKNKGDRPGQMGTNLSYVDLGSIDGKNFTVIEAGGGTFFSCVLSNTGCVKCWGENPFGQLGYGDTETRGDEPGEMGNNLTCVDLGSINGKNFTAIHITLGSAHVCALSSTGCVKCWGINIYGQLGYGDTEARGNKPGDMGNNLSCVDLGSNGITNYTAIHISAGSVHTCAIIDNGKIKCWGQNGYGQCGIGNVTGKYTYIGVKPGDLGNNLSFVDLGTIECPTFVPTENPTLSPIINTINTLSPTITQSDGENTPIEEKDGNSSENTYGLIALIAVIKIFFCCVCVYFCRSRAPRSYLNIA